MGPNFPNVPAQWKWLAQLQGLPLLVQAGLLEYGVLEGPAAANNPTVLGWVHEVALDYSSAYDHWAADFYNSDAIPWCGLFMALCAVRSGGGRPDRMPPNGYLSALAWASWGVPVDFRSSLSHIYLGDVCVFVRSGGGHVAMAVAVTTDNKYVAVLGGNQDNQVNIKLEPIAHLYAVRRVKYITPPAGARNFRISSTGVPVAQSVV